MGLREKLAQAVRGVAREAIVAPIEGAAAWADERERVRKLNELDERIAKAADDARRAGNDGTKPWEDEDDKDPEDDAPPEDGDNARTLNGRGGGENKGGSGHAPDDYQDPGEIGRAHV